MKMAKVIKIPYSPRPLWRDEIHKALDSHRFSVLVCHRRFGKTVGVVNHVIRQAVRCSKRAPQYAYIAPFFAQAKKIAWEYIKYYTGVIPGVKVNNSECFVELPSSHPGSAGARIYILGADNPDSLRGMYLDGVVLDEYGQMKESMWSEILRPALADREGWAVFVGTPKGQNGFYKKWMEAQGNEGWYAVRYKASETGLFPPKELEDMRRTMSDVEYSQEMECDFSIAAENTLLGGDDIEAACKRSYSEMDVVGSTCVMGVDVARFGGDRSVIAVRRGLVMMEPIVFNSIDTMTLAGAVIKAKERFKPDAIFIDSGAMGAGVIDRIRQLGHSCMDVAFGGKAIDSNKYSNRRAEMYFRLADAIKKGGTSLPDVPTLREELANVYYTYDPSGRLKLKGKEDIKALLGRSPDMADAFALTYAESVVRRKDVESPLFNGRGAMSNTDYDFF